MAYNRFHRSLTAGVALVGAGAIAFASVPPPLADEVVAAPPAFVATPRVVTAEVNPVVFATALQILATGAAAAVQESIGTFGDDIPAMWNQVVAQWADPNLLAQNYSLVASTFFAPVAPLVVGPFTDAVAEVVAQAFPADGDEIRENLPAAVDYLFARLVGPWVSAFSAISVAHLGSYEAGMEGDPNARIIALLKAPVDVIDGFLFGGYGNLSPLLTGELDGEPIAAPGLLTPWGQWPTDRNPTYEPDEEAPAATLEQATDEPVELAVDGDPLPLNVIGDISEDAEAETAPEAEPTEAETAAGAEADEAVDTPEESGEESADAPETSPLSLRQGLRELRDAVEKFTGAAATGTSDDSTQTDDAESEKSEKSEASEKSGKSDDDSDGTE